MIFETLAAMAQWNNNKKFDNNASRANCVTTETDINAAGKLTLVDETITWNSDSKTIDEINKYSYFLYAIQKKTPRSVYEDDMKDS